MKFTWRDGMFGRKKVHESYTRNNPCRNIIKDYVPGDFSWSELSPVVRYDPQWQNQMQNLGYAIMQIGDQLRYVYSGNGKNTYECPECSQRFVNRDEFEDHIGARLIDPEGMRNQTVPYSGNMNPPATVGMEPGQDLRSQMSSWDSEELRRNEYKALMKARMATKLSIVLEKRTHASLQKHKLVGGKWVPTPGESGEKPVRSLPETSLEGWREFGGKLRTRIMDKKNEAVGFVDVAVGTRGQASVDVPDWDGKKDALLENIEVDDPGAGFGHSAYHQVEDSLRERGIQRVFAFPVPEAETFWRRMGYRQIKTPAETQYRHHGGELLPLWVKPLTATAKHKFVGGKWVPTPGEGGEPSIREHRNAFIKPTEAVVSKLEQLSGKKVAFRIKTDEAIKDKMQRKGVELDQIMDVGGTRVIVDDGFQQEQMVRNIRQNYKVLEETDYLETPKEGYRAYHMVVEQDGLPVEIQIQTPLQADFQAWAHDFTYKGPLRGAYGKDPEVTTYVDNVSEYLRLKDFGQEVRTPPCPPAISQVGGCFGA